MPGVRIAVLFSPTHLFRRGRAALNSIKRSQAGRSMRPSLEVLESRQVLAVTGLPTTTGDQLANPIVLSTDGAGPNSISISLDDTIKAGFVAATITANTTGGQVTRTYWNFANSITFTGTADTAGTITNTVNLTTLFGGDLTNGATKYDWVNTLDWTPRGLPDVTISLSYADALSLSSTATASNPISLAGTFTSPTLAPTPANPGADLTVNSNSVITVAAAGVSTYNLKVASTANGAPAGIDLQGAVTTVNDLTLTSVNDLPITRALTAGGNATISTAGVAPPPGSISISAPVNTAGNLTITANQSVTTTGGGTLTSTAGAIKATATSGSASFGANLSALNAITLSGNTGLTTSAAAAILSTTGAVALLSTNGDVTATGAMTAVAGTITATASQGGIATGALTALTGITLAGNTNIVIGDDSSITGAGSLTATAATGNVLVKTSAPITVANGQVTITAAVGRIDINSLVQANQAIALKSDQGFSLDNSVDLTAAVLSTGTTGSVTVDNASQQVFVDAPISATAGTGSVSISCANNDVVIRDDLFAGNDLTVSGKTTVTVGGVAAAITLTSLTGTVEVTSTAADVLLGDKLAFVAGPGATAGIDLKSATTVTLPVALTAQGAVNIVSPNGFTLQKAITSALGAVTIAAGAGSLAVTAAPITAGGTITLSSLNQLSLGSVLTSTGGAISLTSTGGQVDVQATAGIVVPDVTKGILGITSATVLGLAIDLTAGNNVVVTTGGTFVSTTDFASVNGSVTITSTTADLDVTGSNISAPAGGVTLAAPFGSVAVSMSKVTTNPVTGTLNLNAGNAVTLPAGAITVGGNITITSGGGFSPAPGSDLTSTNGSVSLTYVGTINLTNINVQASNGGISLTSKTGDVQIGTKTFTTDAGTAGVVTLSAAAGQVTVGQNLTAGGNVTITSLNTFSAVNGVTSNTGNTAITSAAGNIDASAATAVITAPAGSIALTATTGAVLLNAANPLTAPAGITLASGGDLSVVAALTSTLGGLTLSSAAGDVIIAADLTATAGTVTITGFDEVAGTGGNNAITTLVLANTLTVTAGYVNPLAQPLALTNPGNDVDQLSISLTTPLAVPTGVGITYVDSNSLTVNAAVTATGTVNIRSIAGTLTLAGGLGVGGESLNGVVLRSSDALTVNGGITVSVAGNISLTSDNNAINVNGPIAAANGTVTLTSSGGTGIVVSSLVSATGAITLTGSTGVTVGAGGVAVSSLGGNIAVTSATGAVTINGNVTTNVGDVTITAPAGLVNVAGGINAGVGVGDDVTVAAGPLLQVTGNVFAGGDCTFTSTAGITLGPTSTITANSGDVTVTSTNGAVTVSSTIAATQGSIFITNAPGTIVFTGGSLTAAAAYVAGPPAVGLISISATAITANTNPTIVAGRFEVLGTGGGNTAFTSLGNMVSTLAATTAGNFTFVNAIPLTLTDFNNAAPSVQVQGRNISITSTTGLRVIDGITYTGTLTLVGPGAGTRGVEFVPSSTGDATGAFSGSLRNMVNYVNANAATSQPMSIVFDEPGTTLATTTGEINLQTSLPTLVKPITFNGQLPSGGANLGGNVGVHGGAVPVNAAANGLTLGTGSSGSNIRNACFSGFAGTGISVQTSNNLLSGLVLGARRDGVAAGNGVGIDLTGAAASRNTIGVQTVGQDLPNEIVNNAVAGIRIRSTANYNLLYGNFVGVTSGGVAAGNKGDGVAVSSCIGTVIGGTTAVLGNTISNNAANGVRLTDVFAPLLTYGAQLVGNVISDNGAAGVRIEGGGRNLVGGSTAAAANLITDNQDGVVLSSSLAVTQGNSILGNTISGSLRYGASIDLAFGNTIDGNAVTGSGTAGISITRAAASATRAANQVVRNLVSTNGDGSADSGGIVLENSSGQLVGRLVTKELPEHFNTVIDNQGSGIVILGGSNPSQASLNTVVNNFVGVTPAGTAAANQQDGIRVVGGITNSIRGNIVRHNLASGVSLIDARATSPATGNIVAGNIVGNNDVGISVAGGANNLLGGTLSSAGNRIFSSISDGIRVESSLGTGAASGTVVRNNLIGLDANSQAAGNAAAGVRVTNAVGTVVDYQNVVMHSGAHGVVVQGGRNNSIGSSIASKGNVLKQNTGDGIRIEEPAAGPSLTQAVTIAGNAIESNTAFGITVSGSRTSGVTIGRTPSVSQPTGAENTIRGNTGGGVQVDAAVAVTIVGNAIINNGATPSNAALQIQLVNNGNPNVNASVAPPILTSAQKRVAGQALPQFDVAGTVSGAVGQRFFVDFYGRNSDLGEMRFLGRVSVTVGRGNTGAFRAIVGALARIPRNVSINQIVATATPASSLNGGTSAFSNLRNV